MARREAAAALEAAVAGAAGDWGRAGLELEAPPAQRPAARAGEQELRVDGAEARALAARVEKPAQVVSARVEQRALVAREA